MKSYRKYTTYEKERKVFATIMLLILVIILAWGVFEIVTMNNQAPAWPGEVKEYPMANAKISWEQTHHPGPWGSGD